MNDFQKTFPKIKSNEIIPQNYKINGCDGRFITYATYPINIFNNRDKTNLNLKNITGWVGAWAECDLFSVDEQLDIIKELDIEPTFVTFSGNKSLHSTFIYDQKITNRKVQENILKGLCVLLHGDPACKNPDRSVRQPNYMADDRQQPIIFQKNKVYDPFKLLDIIEKKINERFNCNLDEAFNRLEYYKKDIEKIKSLPSIPSKEITNKNVEWTNDLDDVHFDINGNKITVREFIESGVKSISLICHQPNHMEKNHSAYMIRNKNNVIVGCHGCGFKKSYKIKAIEKDYSDIFDIITINERYIPSDLLLKYNNVILFAQTCSGKTTAVKNSNLTKTKKSLVVSHLVNLTKNMAATLQTKFYHDKDGPIFIDNGSTACCINSIWRIVGRPEFLFVDEIMQVINSIVSGTVEDKENIMCRLQEMIIQADKVALADAHIDLDTLYNLLKPLGKRFTVIRNLWVSGRERILYHKEVNFFKAVDEALNENCFHYCASKAQCDALEAYLIEKCKNGKIININKDTAVKFASYFEIPNSLYENYDGPIHIIASPSLGSGISITHEDITVFCHAESGEHVSAHSLWQGMERIRKPKSTHIYVGVKNINLPEDYTQIYNNELNSQFLNDKYCLAIINGKREFANKPMIELFSKIVAKDNFYKNNIKEEFIKLLKEDGSIKKSQIRSDAKETCKFQKDKQNNIKKVKKDKAKSILNAKKLTSEEYSILSKNIDDGIYVSIEDINSMKNFRYSKYFDLNEDLIYDLEFNGLLKKIYRFSNLICFDNSEFKKKMVKSDFESDRKSKWGNAKDPLYYSQLERFVSLTLGHTSLKHIRSLIYTRCAPQHNSMILQAESLKTVISEFSMLTNVSTDDLNKYVGNVLNSLGIKTKTIKSKHEDRKYEVDLDSLKFMMDISKKVIKKNLEPNTIDSDLKEIFKKYEDNL